MFSCKQVQLVKNQYRNAHFQKRMRKRQDDYYWLVNNNNKNNNKKHKQQHTSITNTINKNKLKTRKLTLCIV